MVCAESPDHGAATAAMEEYTDAIGQLAGTGDIRRALRYPGWTAALIRHRERLRRQASQPPPQPYTPVPSTPSTTPQMRVSDEERDRLFRKYGDLRTSATSLPPPSPARPSLPGPQPEAQPAELPPMSSPQPPTPPSPAAPPAIAPPVVWMGWMPPTRRYLHSRRLLRALRRRFLTYPVRPCLRLHRTLPRRFPSPCKTLLRHPARPCPPSRSAHADATTPAMPQSCAPERPRRVHSRRSWRVHREQRYSRCYRVCHFGGGRSACYAPLARVAYGEGVGRSRSGPTSIRSVVSPAAATYPRAPV